MNPHFIFNSINTIQGYITEQNTLVAKRLLTKFARLMRLILESSAVKMIPLDKEIALLTLYLELTQMGTKIGVTALCPELISTGIGESQRNRPR